jgi:F-type H+-transporting ATPase subunit gamma
MKTLAAVSIRQYDRAVEALRDYSRTIDQGFQVLLRHEPLHVDADRHRGRVGAIILGTDQGMCGQFNEEIVAFASQRQTLAPPSRPWLLAVVGARAAGFLAEQRWRSDATFPVPTSATDITNLVLDLLPLVDHWRQEANVTQLLVFHNHRTSASSYRPRELQLLPIDARNLTRWRHDPWDSNSLPTFKSPPKLLLSRLVRQYLFVSVYLAAAESLASENASRIAAMQSAERNIEDRLEELQGTFHQLRQSAITEELRDVVAGFETLRKHNNASSPGV